MRGARAFGRSSDLRSRHSEVSTAMKDAPLNRNAQPVPTEAMSSPAIAGPTMRAALNQFSAMRVSEIVSRLYRALSVTKRHWALKALI